MCTLFGRGTIISPLNPLARSSTLMNFAGISNSEIECIIDRNSIKHDLFTPGTNIPIVSYEEGIQKFNGKHLLLLAWNFEDEVVRDLRADAPYAINLPLLTYFSTIFFKL